jgi:hypothetical protein
MMTMARRLQAPTAGVSAIAAFVVLAVLPASASAAEPASVHQLAGAHATAPARADGSTGTAISGAGGTHANSSASFDQEACNGDVCMILYWNGTSAYFTIEVGANSNTFYGYFHLSGPGGPFSPANTPTEQWNAHGLSTGDFAQLTIEGQPQSGTYCESAWQDGASLGKACVPYGVM